MMQILGFLKEIRKMGKVFLDLSKVRITIMVMLTTAMGFLMGAREFQFLMCYPIFGTFILACGSSALNHWQDRHLDKKMTRTKLRPIPSGKISPILAFLFALTLIFCGASLLYFGAGWMPFLLGGVALCWYNGVYTYMKRISSLAVIPGSLIGALPPMIGWATLGHSISEKSILSVALFMFIWQIPHFWLILLIHHGDYKKSNLPILSDKISISTIAKWIYWGNILMICSAMSLFFSGTLSSVLSMVILSGSSLFIVLSSNSLRKGESGLIRPIFMKVNFYALVVIFTVMTESFSRL